jgi:putative membrane protein insertion efficiency factor
MVFIWGWGGGGPRRRRGWGGPWSGRRGPGYGGYGGYGRGHGYGRGYGRGYGHGYGRGHRRDGDSCLRDLLFLNTGCCLANAIGCGVDMFLVAPSTVRQVRAAGVPGGRVADRLVAAVRVYQREVSPRRRPCCSFTPTCSAYAVGALEQHGARRGTWLTVRRLLRCRPGAVGGPDPVPPGPVTSPRLPAQRAGALRRGRGTRVSRTAAASGTAPKTTAV